MESRQYLLRTLSDGGEVKDVFALLMDGKDTTLGEEECPVMAQNGASVNYERLELESVESPASDSSKDDSNEATVGDEDEGFDEEFCDMEEAHSRHPVDVPPLPLHIHDLNQQELQSLLMESSFPDPIPLPFPPSSLLDDIDPGVYMLEPESSTVNAALSADIQLVKTPVSCPPSPYHMSSPSPSPVCANLQSMTLSEVCDVETGPSGWGLPPSSIPHDVFTRPEVFDETSQFLAHSPAATLSNYSSSFSSVHSAAALTPTSGEYDLDMLVSETCPLSSTAGPFHDSYSSTYPSSSTSSSSSPFLSRVVPSHDSAPTITCNLTFQMQLGHSSSHPPPPAIAPVTRASSCSPLPSPLRDDSTAVTKLLPPTSLGYNIGTNSAPSPGVCLAPSTPSSSSSCSTQTPASPAPSCSPCSVPSVCSDSNSQQCQAPVGEGGIIHMPFHKFKRILDSTSVADCEKSDIKTIRRRGKNKIAAKNCRQRKLELIQGLQQEEEEGVDGAKQTPGEGAELVPIL